VLAAPFGMKIELSPGEVERVRDYAEEAAGKELIIEDKVRIEIIKADVKERKGKAVLLLRYRHIEGF